MANNQNLVTIISDDIDISSEILSKYLNFHGSKFKLITPSSANSFNEILAQLSESDAILLRRGDFPVNKFAVPELSSETKVIKDYLHFVFENNTNSIGKLRAEYEHNKLIDLWVAKKCGLTIPQSMIVTSRKELYDILNKKDCGSYITKSLKNALKIQNGDTVYHAGYTTEILVDQIPRDIEEFYPSLLQEKIEKTLEVRSFYLKKRIYSMAIFSQSNDKTALDYRNYDNDKPNRCVPYKLPHEIENSIQHFMVDIDLNCGSLDFMLGTDGEYYFLEVNPVGQFGWLSHNCNYYLEEKIAQLLTQD